MSLRETRYQAAQYGFRERAAQREILNRDDVTAWYCTDREWFRLFSARENAVHVVFCAHSRDPRWQSWLDALVPLASAVRKLVVVDLAHVPDFAVDYGVHGPTLLKVFRQLVLQRLEGDEPEPQALAQFVLKTSHPRWRYTDVR